MSINQGAPDPSLAGADVDFSGSEESLALSVTPASPRVTGDVEADSSGGGIGIGTIAAPTSISLTTMASAQTSSSAVVVVTPILSRSVARVEMFVGRGADAEEVLRWLAPAIASEAASMVVAGMGGVGKTALARHAAMIAVERGWFVDAVIVDMRGYAPDGRIEAVHLFAPLLRALHIPAADIPADAD